MHILPTITKRLGRYSARIALGIMAVLVVPFVGFTQIVSADTPADCPSGAVCVWENANYTGARVFFYSNPVGYCWNMPATINDKVSSIVNHTSHAVKFYFNAGCPHPSWPTIVVGAGLTYSNLSGSGMNDTISSYIN